MFTQVVIVGGDKKGTSEVFKDWDAVVVVESQLFQIRFVLSRKVWKNQKLNFQEKINIILRG